MFSPVGLVVVVATIYVVRGHTTGSHKDAHQNMS